MSLVKFTYPALVAALGFAALLAPKETGARRP